MSRPAVARIHLGHLRHNYRLIRARAGTADVMAVVKANAYGHGLHLVAPALYEAGCRHFAVTDAEEALMLRQYVAGKDIAIALLSGIFDAGDADLCAAHGFTPVISEPRQIDLLEQADFHGRIWLKLETGMHRIGAADPQTMLERLSRAGIGLAGLMSHLACADTPEHPMNRAQAEAFRAMHRRLAPDAAASLLNSAGIVAMPSQALDVVRPGIALYGAEPVTGTSFGLKAVMQLSGGIMQIRELTPGDAVSYGADFVAERQMRVAVVALGYADGVPRGLSRRGEVVIRGTRCPIIGRVCMDYTLIDVSDCDCSPADTAEFWGETMSANHVARQLDTISYTLFTGVGARVSRHPISS